MISTGRVLLALVAAPALLLAGCASTVAGEAKPAVTYPSSPTSVESSTPDTSSIQITDSPTTSGSEIPPVPPSTSVESDTTETDTTDDTTQDTTDTTESTDTSTTESSDTIGGVSVPDVLSDLEDDDVAMVNSKADADDMAAAVADARGGGLDLSVVSIGDAIDDSDAGDIADAIFKEVKGTVLVLTPSTITSRSDQLTSAQLKAANHAASGGKDDLAAVQQYAASALGDDTPTTTSTSKKTTSAAPTKDMVNGVDVHALAVATGDDGVYVQKGVTGVDPDDLADLVTSSKTKDLDLSIVILDKDVTGHLYDVADGIRKYTKGTVIAMSPTVYAISSGSYSNSELQAAINAAADDTTYLDVAKDMTKSLLSN